MAEVQLPGSCLGIPIDHRLKPLLGTGLKTPHPFAAPGGHARAVEIYGRHLQSYREDISENEIKFAKWLAMPETRGGVVVVLQQPAEHQCYFSDHHDTVKDCDTLGAIDEVCKAVTGYGLESISCFDAFPFHKIPVNKSLDKYEEELDNSYATFLHMIQQKQPDVVLCCYRSPHSYKYKDFSCIGIGRTFNSQVTVQGQSYTRVNGFHPSYALNYLEDKSALRILFVIEATQAFCRANNTWRESSWMTDVRNNCAAIVQDDVEDKQLQPSWTKHDFQRERFQIYMGLITTMVKDFESGAYDDMTNDELYDLVLEKRYNVVFSNCLLVLLKIIHFEERGGDRLQDKGFAQLRQREERDVRELKRNVEKRCDGFLRSLRAAEVPFQVEKGGKGLFTLAGLSKNLLPLRLFTHQSGFHSNLRLSVRSLVQVLNSAYRYRGRDIYDVDRRELAEAFRHAAGYLEWALAQHATSTRRWAPQEDLAISSQLESLMINRSPLQTNYVAHPEIFHSRTMPALSSTFPQSQPFTPSRHPLISTVSPHLRSAVWSSIHTPPGFSAMSPTRSQQAAIFSWSRPCTRCTQSGHSSSRCPRTECYRCKYLRTRDGFGDAASLPYSMITEKGELTL